MDISDEILTYHVSAIYQCWHHRKDMAEIVSSSLFFEPVRATGSRKVVQIFKAIKGPTGIEIRGGVQLFFSTSYSLNTSNAANEFLKYLNTL